MAPELSLSSVKRIKKKFFKISYDMKTTIEITNGPSREELFDGLRLFSEKRPTPFQAVKNGKEKYFAVFIHSVEAEDGSGQSWNLVFSVNSRYLSDEFFADKAGEKEPWVIAIPVGFSYFKQLLEEKYPMPGLRENLVRVKAYYSTKSRKGVIIGEE
jgi:hypothetical protein